MWPHKCIPYHPAHCEKNLNENQIIEQNFKLEDLQITKNDALLIDEKKEDNWTFSLKKFKKDEDLCGRCLNIIEN